MTKLFCYSVNFQIFLVYFLIIYFTYEVILPSEETQLPPSLTDFSLLKDAIRVIYVSIYSKNVQQCVRSPPRLEISEMQRNLN